MSELQSPSDLADLVTLIDNWLNEFAEEGEHVLAIDRGTSDETSFGEPRWYVRLAGESKEIVTIWLTLGQRTLRYETYVMPAPEDNAAELADQLLRRNDRLVGRQEAPPRSEWDGGCPPRRASGHNDDATVLIPGSR